MTTGKKLLTLVREGFTADQSLPSELLNVFVDGLLRGVKLMGYLHISDAESDAKTGLQQ